MNTPNEATPAEQRMESKIDLALRQLDDITQGVAALIAERDAALAKVKELEGESGWEHSVYYKIATDFDWMLQARDTAEQQVSDLRKALEGVQRDGYEQKAADIADAVLAATAPEAETERD